MESKNKGKSFIDMFSLIAMQVPWISIILIFVILFMCCYLNPYGKDERSDPIYSFNEINPKHTIVDFDNRFIMSNDDDNITTKEWMENGYKGSYKIDLHKNILWPYKAKQNLNLSLGLEMTNNR